MARSATVVMGVGKRAGLAAAVGSTEVEAALAMAERLWLGEQLWLTAWGSEEG